MKPLVFLLALPAYLALFSITSHARAMNTTSSAAPSTRLAPPTGSLDHRHRYGRMQARFRVRHRQAIKSEGDSSGAVLSVKDLEGLRKRELSRLTFFTPGLGACGGRNTNDDFIVALSAQDWDGGSHCNDKITILYNGRSVHAKIVDECMSCPAGGLDLSAGLFSFLADPDMGSIYGQWMYGAGETTTHTRTQVASQTHAISSSAPSTYAHHSSHTNSTHSASLPNATHSSSSNVSQRILPTSSAAPFLPKPTSFLEDINILILQYSSLLEAAAEDTVKRGPSSV